MIRPIQIFIFLSAGLLAALPPRTLRVDYYHTGGLGIEVFAQDRTVIEPLPWPGSVDQRIDESNLGQYRFEVRTLSSHQLCYSRGFSSIFGEWETTEEAKKQHRTFSESLRFPDPGKPVEIQVQKRDGHNGFQPVWSFTLDPRDRYTNSAPPPHPETLLTLQKMGEPAAKVDLLILGDGYTREERPKFEKDARRLMEILFTKSPYKEHRQDFNVWGLCPPAAQSGISRPSTGIQRRSPLGCTYDVFGSERYVLTLENRTLRDIASYAPYEFIEILVNGDTYGGGGIFGLYGTVPADNFYASYIFVHEFGHHFAGLADEYYTSDVAYETGKARTEPWEPNVTADPSHPKWTAALTAGIPLPTPWKKRPFEVFSEQVQIKRRQLRNENRPEEELNAHFQAEQDYETKLLGTDVWSGKVGAFEGALYESTGYYRAQEDCIMFSRDPVPFCEACRRAIERSIGMYSK